MQAVPASETDRAHSACRKSVQDREVAPAVVVRIVQAHALLVRHSRQSGRGRCQCVDVASAEDRVTVVAFPLTFVEHLHTSIRSPDPHPPLRIFTDRRAVVRFLESRLLTHVLPLRILFLPAQAVDAASLRCNPQVLRTRQAGSCQELRR